MLAFLVKTFLSQMRVFYGFLLYHFGNNYFHSIDYFSNSYHAVTFQIMQQFCFTFNQLKHPFQLQLRVFFFFLLLYSIISIFRLKLINYVLLLLVLFKKMCELNHKTIQKYKKKLNISILIYNNIFFLNTCVLLCLNCHFIYIYFFATPNEYIILDIIVVKSKQV